MNTLISLRAWLRNMVSWVKSFRILRGLKIGISTTDKWPPTTKSFDVTLPQSSDIRGDSLVDYVLDLSKKQLIFEVYRLRAEIEKFRALKELSDQGLQDALGAYQRLSERNEERLDKYLEHQAVILDQKLGLNQTNPSMHSEMKSIQIRKPWNQVAAKFEADKRQEYWKQRNKQTEELDKKVIQPEKK